MSGLDKAPQQLIESFATNAFSDAFQCQFLELIRWLKARSCLLQYMNAIASRTEIVVYSLQRDRFMKILLHKVTGSSLSELQSAPRCR